jgi:GNAT superfamily N-acetyltransferase
VTSPAVRVAEPEDTAEVARLVGMMFSAIGLADDPEWARYVEGSLVDGIAVPSFVVVVDDPDRPGRLAAVGASVINVRLPRPGDSVRRVGYIQWMATDPSQRRQGHATRIVQRLLAWCESEGADLVELHASAEGESVYRAAGFGDPSQIALSRVASRT